MANQLQNIKARFGIVGASALLDAALETAIRVAPTDLSVLIMGESGVGKEVFSKIIHALSTRKHNEFIAVNCGAIPEGTINSELFGHEKGSFTGAVSDRKGYFETVNGGTIFLDEIAEMPLDTQSYLLRVLESGEFLRVGSSKVQKTDVRVIAATNVDLEERVRKGKFREDLYYRLSTVPIRVPALKDRREDIPVLFRKFAFDFAEKYRMDPIRLSPQAQFTLETYRWPGNIRELKNVAEQLSVLSEERDITEEALLQQMPHLFSRNLPAITGRNGSSGRNGNDFQEREIFYKLLVDMKTDLNDLKALFFELINRNNLQMPDLSGFGGLRPGLNFPHSEQQLSHPEDHDYSEATDHPADSRKVMPIILEPSKTGGGYERTDVEDAPLAMDEIEKEAIKRALKKYNGRRKEAAEELKISERTLYRKIKQYNL
ncbi:MAG: sigma-54-dependent Fis family transcriptional regulator [Lewinellaceae bacterium]|nr:sigma-54-dependent Fis family transcriptional regulator [Saprospiraceae bacterium]MCB9329467.1 sigma-54-dependent Fis family transcriptional regulator [Lewinellaceae bacterium]